MKDIEPAPFRAESYRRRRQRQQKRKGVPFIIFPISPRLSPAEIAKPHPNNPVRFKPLRRAA